jgi:hypothetical protein
LVFRALSRDVFVSYSSRDLEKAEAVRSGLEGRGIKCWMAPRDILPGTSFEESIIKAINECKVFVLIFTAASCHSSHVENEVRIAWTRDMPIIPFRLEDVALSNIMNYYIGSKHWLDATTPPIEKHVSLLADNVAQLLGQPGEEKVPPVPVETVVAGQTSPSARKKPVVLVVALGIVLIVVLIIVVAVMSNNSAPGAPPAAAASATPTPVADNDVLMAPPGSIQVPTPTLPDNLSSFQIRVTGGLKPDVTVTLADMRNMSFVRIDNVEKSLQNGNSYIADYTGIPVMAIIQIAGLPAGNLSFQVISQDDFTSRFTEKQLENSIIGFYQNDVLNDANIDSKNAIKLVPMGLPGAEFWVKMPKEIRIYTA